MWEFSHSTEKACCTNRLHDWALPNKHAPGQSTHWSLSHSHAAAPEVPLWRCDNTSGENNPMAWNIYDRWWSYVNVITSVYPFPIFQVMNCHLATRDLCNRARIPQGGGAQMFSRMSESRQMGAHYFFPFSEKYAGKYLWHWHLLVCTPIDVERSIQCQGDESLSMELIISITHGHAALSCLLARQDDCQEHYKFSSGRKCQGRMCSEVRTLNEEWWLQEKSEKKKHDWDWINSQRHQEVWNISHHAIQRLLYGRDGCFSCASHLITGVKIDSRQHLVACFLPCSVTFIVLSCVMWNSRCNEWVF